VIQSKRSVVVLIGALVAFATLSVAGCRQGGDDVERAKATAEQEQNRAAAAKIERARRAALDERNQYLATIKSEQVDLRQRLQAELDEVEKKLGATTDQTEIDGLSGRRTTLKADLDALDASHETDWDALRARIEVDLGKDALERPRART
jgi:hypothetical protein